ncbi:uncharacterized protein LOC110372876 [Helicoverpa armigera]|uniref:uncharacterized protein LOC110372876 n=1 Tax=Helicoverpa armigera TaxID=29058 RepID=UPI003083B1B8
MGSVKSTLSNILYISEKVTLCVTCTALIACLMIMFSVTLGMGVGLGYNYCFVDLKTKVKYVPTHYKYRGSPRLSYVREEEPGPTTQDVKDAEKAQIIPKLEKTESPTVLNQSVVLLGNNTTPFVVYNISIPYHNDDDDFTVAPSNTISFANTSRYQTGADETTTEEPTTEEPTTDEPTIEDPTPDVPAEGADDDSETTVYSSEDGINELDEPTPEAPINSNDPNNRRVRRLVIPISSLDLDSLLSKLKAENKKYSFRIIAT